MNTPRIARLARLTFAWTLLGLSAAAPSDTIIAEPSDNSAAFGAGAGLRKSVIAAGGGASISGSTSVRGTVGQPVASLAAGSTLKLTSGFWAASEAPPTCFGDANHDGAVDFADITSVLANFNMMGAAPLMGDANASGGVDFADITSVLSAFNTICE